MTLAPPHTASCAELDCGGGDWTGVGCAGAAASPTGTPLQVQFPSLQTIDPSHVTHRPFVHTVLAPSDSDGVKSSQIASAALYFNVRPPVPKTSLVALSPTQPKF
jgi:hypothetical protein